MDQEQEAMTQQQFQAMTEVYYGSRPWDALAAVTGWNPRTFKRMGTPDKPVTLTMLCKLADALPEECEMRLRILDQFPALKECG